MGDNTNFDLAGFLNSPQAQANKPAAMQYLRSKGIIDNSGRPIPGMSKVAPAQPTIGSAGQTLISGSTLGQNLRALPGQLLNIIPGGNAIASSLGAAGRNIGLLAQGKNPNIPVDIPKTVGGYLKAGSAVAAAGLPIATGATVGARLGQAALGYGALGSIAGAGNALENKQGPVGVLKSASVGGVEGAAAGVVGQGITEGVRALKSPVAKGIAATGKDATDIKNIQETIAPKLTLKEQRLALAEGRIIPGQDPTLFRGGTADQVIPSAKQTQSAIVIKDNIPGAATMKQPELYAALDAKTTEMARALRPAMEVTPVTQDTIGQITDAWEATKAAQLADPYSPLTDAQIARLQHNFETNFLQASKGENMADLWDTAIGYDRSVPANVKSATINSSDILQAQKSIWLQNRAVLRDAITNASTGMGEVAQKTFQEMHSMYNAQNAIQSSIKVIKEGAPSRLVQLAKKHPYITGAIATGAVGATGIPKAAVNAVMP